jgi:hypothetical protein
MFKKLFYFTCLVLFNQNVKAVTFEQYITDHASGEMRSYLTGYADAIHNNAYLLGGCPRKLQYRPYGEYFQHIDIYIAKKTKDQSVDIDAFYQESVEPLLTAVILKYIDCNNPEAMLLKNEPKRVQIEIRNIAKDIMDKTKKYQSPKEMEMEFQYKEYLDRVNNPKKYEKKCPVCKVQKQSIFRTIPVTTPPVEPPIVKSQNIIPMEVRQTPTEDKNTFPLPKSSNDIKNDSTAAKIYDIPREENQQNQQESTNINNVPSTVPLNEEQQPEKDNKKEQPYQEPPSKRSAEKILEHNKINEKKIQPQITKDDLLSIPEVKIPENNSKQKPYKPNSVVDVNDKKYELESLEMNLDNLKDVTLPPI